MQGHQFDKSMFNPAVLIFFMSWLYCMLDRNNSKFALTILYYFLFFNFVFLIEQAKTKDLLSTCNIYTKFTCTKVNIRCTWRDSAVIYHTQQMIPRFILLFFQNNWIKTQSCLASLILWSDLCYQQTTGRTRCKMLSRFVFTCWIFYINFKSINLLAKW